MRVVVTPLVEAKINAFYDAAMDKHSLLSEQAVMTKKNRLIASLQILSITQGFKKAQYNRLWIANGWRELIVEDFHFAFEEVMTLDGEHVVIVRDAVHSLLYR